MLNVKNIYYLGFIFLFLPCFVLFFVPHSSIFVHVGLFFWLLLYLYVICKPPELFVPCLKYLLKSRFFIIYLIFLLYIIIDTICHLVLGYSLANWYTNLFSYIRTSYIVLLIYFFPALGLLLNIKLKNIIKLIYIMTFCVCILGLIQYVGFKLLGINLISFLTNNRYGYPEWADVYNCKVFSVFKEPSLFAIFIFQYLPVIMKFSLSNFKIFDNKIVNFIFKNLTIPLLFIMLILTKSPIWLIFITIEFIVLMIIIKKKTIIRNSAVIITFLTIAVLFSFLILLINPINITQEAEQKDRYLSRIVIVVKAKNNMYELVKNEPSLATRLISDVLNIKTFKQNKFFGVGYGNSPSYANRFFVHIDIPLTQEFQQKYTKNKYPGLNSTLLFTFLAEYGLIGTSLFYIFLLFNILLLNKIQKKIYGLHKNMCLSVKYSIIATVCVSFYDFYFGNMLFWLIMGFVPYLFLYYKTNKTKLLKVNGG